MNSKHIKILEGLKVSREYTNKSVEKRVNESIEDVAVCIKSEKEVAKLIEKELTKKYDKVFKDYGGVYFDVSIYASDDSDLCTEDVIHEIDIAMGFNKKIADKEKEVRKLVDKTLEKDIWETKYDSKDEVFYINSEDYSDIIEILYGVQSVVKSISRMWEVVSHSDILDNIEQNRREYEEEQRMLWAEYNRDRM